MTQNSSTTQPSQTEVRKARSRAVFLWIMAIVTIVSLVYAYVQQIKAERNAEEAFRQRELAITAQRMAEMNALEATKQADIAKRMLEECRQSKGK